MSVKNIEVKRQNIDQKTNFSKGFYLLLYSITGL